MGNIRWGILSTAGIGQQQVIPAIQRAGNGTVSAIASRGEKAKEVAEKFHIEKAYTSYDQLLADPDIDAVYVPLPNSLHKHWVIEAAKNRKHVLCEKPAALNTNQLEEMIAVCKNNNVLFMEAFMYQFHPQHEKVKELLRASEIGEVHYMEANFSFFLGEDTDNIRLNHELGGGSLYDVGCYCIHSIRNVLESEAISVFATANHHNGVDTTATGVITLENGVDATFNSSFELTGRNEYQIVGSTGIIEVLAAYRPDEDDHEGIVRVKKADGEVIEHHANDDQYKAQVEHFASCIIEGKTPVYHSEKMIANMKVLDACYQSIRDKRVVVL